MTKQYETKKIVIIGMGFLMQYIAPCYQNFIPKKRRNAQILGTTAEPDLEKVKEVSQKVGFPILKGHNLEALTCTRPDLILFAVPTALAERVAEEEVAPYYAKLRACKEELPDFYAFTPKPVGSDYVRILGEDIAIANIIPNMFTQVGGKDITEEGRILVALAKEGKTWTKEKQDCLRAFFAPLGPVVMLSPKEQPAILASFSAGRVITDILFDTAEILKLPVEALASCVRAYFGEQFAFKAPASEGSSEVSFAAVPEAYREICKAISLGWIEGVLCGVKKEGITQEQIKETTLPLYDLRIHMLQMTDRVKIEQDMRKHASKGGVFEHACHIYTLEVSRDLKNFLRQAAVTMVEKEAFAAFRESLSEKAEMLYEHVLMHSKTLNQKEEQKELRPEHHAALFGFLAKRCIQRFGEEGKKTVLDCASLYGRQRGQRMALRCMGNKEPLDMDHYLVYGEWRALPGEADNRVASYEPEYTTHSYRCPWCEGWKKNDLLEYGKLYCLAVDHGVVRGFNPKLSIEIRSLQSMGDPVCEFVWTGAKVHSEEEKQNIEKKKKELTATCSKDFRYHTGHLYHVFATFLAERYKEQGIDVCEAALFDYRRTYGVAYEFPLEGNYESVDEF